MKNPTPGKNPFELESYRDRMPLHVRELYDDMTRNYAKLQGRAGLGRFWRFWAFAVCYLALLMVISDTTTDTILVFVGLVLTLLCLLLRFRFAACMMTENRCFGPFCLRLRFFIYLLNSRSAYRRTGLFGEFSARLLPWLLDL